MDVGERLAQLDELREQGILDAEQYAQAVRQLAGNAASPNSATTAETEPPTTTDATPSREKPNAGRWIAAVLLSCVVIAGVVVAVVAHNRSEDVQRAARARAAARAGFAAAIAAENKYIDDYNNPQGGGLVPHMEIGSEQGLELFADQLHDVTWPSNWQAQASKCASDARNEVAAWQRYDKLHATDGEQAIDNQDRQPATVAASAFASRLSHERRASCGALAKQLGVSYKPFF